MYAIFVTLNVQPEKIEAFEQASLGDALGSCGNEPECFRFDILKDPAITGRYYLYEVYLNADSLEKHRATPHFQKWWGTVEAWFTEDLAKIEMDTIFPTDSGWEAQKPHLLLGAPAASDPGE